MTIVVKYCNSAVASCMTSYLWSMLRLFLVFGEKYEYFGTEELIRVRQERI